MISIVTTMYYSASYLDEFTQRIVKTVSSKTDSYEIIFVNDGSPDNSLAKARELREKYENVKVLDLSRNFGHHKAVLAGLQKASGDLVFLIDCDLEEPPEIFETMYDTLDNSSVDVVYGVQEKRKGRWFEQLSGKLFYTIFNAASDIKINNNILMVRLMRKKYVDALLRMEEKNVFLGGMFEFVGFNQQPLVIHKKDKGISTYTLRKKLQMLVESLTSFSSLPLKIIFYIGTFISIFSFIYIAFLIGKKLILGHTIEAGWTSLMVSIWFLSGVILMSIGVVGIYLSKIFHEVKNRPRHIVKDFDE